METSYIHIIKELSVPEVIDFIDRNIESFSTDDLAKLRDAVISVIYESNNIEEGASIITTHLLKQFRQADLRIKGKYDVARNEMLGNKYLSLCVSCLEKMPHLYFSLDEDSIRILEDLGYTQKDEKQNQPQDTSEGTGKKPELKNNTPKKRGRPKKAFKDNMINDADGSKLQKVHRVMAGKKGRDAALIMTACVKIGWMTSPTFPQVAEEFGDIGTQQNFTKYLNEKQFTKEEIEGAINSLVQS